MYSSLLSLSLLGWLLLFAGCSSRNLPQTANVPIKKNPLTAEMPPSEGLPSEGLPSEERPSEEPESGPSLLIHVSGARSTKGKYACALFANSDDFASRANPVVSANLPLDQSTWAVSDLPPGQYAAAVFHDENLDGKLDRHGLGYPTEAYGFSNNARGRFGPPGFEDAEFEFADENLEITIDLK